MKKVKSVPFSNLPVKTFFKTGEGDTKYYKTGEKVAINEKGKMVGFNLNEPVVATVA